MEQHRVSKIIDAMHDAHAKLRAVEGLCVDAENRQDHVSTRSLRRALEGRL